MSDRITTPLSLAHQRKNKQKKIRTNFIPYEAYTNQRSNIRREEVKRKKKFSLLQGKSYLMLPAEPAVKKRSNPEPLEWEH